MQNVFSVKRIIMGKIKNVFENGFIKKEMYIRFTP